MNAGTPTDREQTPSLVGRLESLCDRFEDAWRDGERPSLEEFLEGRAESTELMRELLVLEVAYRRRAGDRPHFDEYLARFPGRDATIREVFAAVEDGRDVSTLFHGAPEPGLASDATTSPGTPVRGESIEHHVRDALARTGYEIIRELGRGGMGIVYEARQVALERVVALKVLKSGLFATDEECRRFINEAEAVARLDHPAIVPIFDVRRNRGLYFYSMRKIAGTGLDRRLDQGPLDRREAARIVARIARAVDDAHRHGILHRDIKPANILLDQAGEPFLTDFGLARRLDGEGAEATRTGSVLGTPSYMSPEQVEGRTNDLTTATDIFGLGGVLYAALTGRAPHAGSSVADTFERVRKVTPEAPSRINPRIPRDLDSVCLKCLEKDPKRRYGSANELADDLDRWLAGEPTRARPVSPLARAGMWVRRHPVPAALALALLMTLLAGIAGITWQWREANRARHRSDRFADYLTNRVLAQASTEVNPYGANVTVREMLDKQAARLGGDFQDEPEIEATIRETFGNTYHSLGLFAQAEDQLRQALKLTQQTAGTESPAAIRISTRLGRILAEAGGLAEAERLLSRTRDAAVRTLGPNHPDTLEATARLGAIYLARHRADEAEPLLRQALDARRRVLPTDHPDTLRSINDLCQLAIEAGRYREAEPLAHEYEHGIRCARGPNHPDNITALMNQGRICRLQGNDAQAEPFYSKAAEEARRILGPDHPAAASAGREYTALLQNLKKPMPPSQPADEK